MDRFSSEFLLHEELVLVWMREDVLDIQTGPSETKLSLHEILFNFWQCQSRGK